MATPSTRLGELGLELPPVAAPLAAYVPSKVTGNMARSSGQLPFKDGELTLTGKVGAEVSLDEAYEAARLCALNALASVAQTAGGIDSIASIIHVTGYVASAPDFYDQPKVINGASELFADIFGTGGKHTRSAVGVAVLPLNVPVELEIVCQIVKSRID
ncbi:RidA family protein [Flaviflexus massiliensis]|uniref:RidA family protein n=1 Tax=Flaviflexus massiliensis TaxID=1522309 RepID=UPI0006D5612D|nr:RidA family protein [Flaviflexus massiliensis]